MNYEETSTYFRFENVSVSEISGSHSGKYVDCCVVAPCSLVEVYRRFRGAYCLHHQGDEFIIITYVNFVKEEFFTLHR
jgi:hypothetical protein